MSHRAVPGGDPRLPPRRPERPLTPLRALAARVGWATTARVGASILLARARGAPFGDRPQPTSRQDRESRAQAGPAILLYRALQGRTDDPLGVTAAVIEAAALRFLEQAIGRLGPPRSGRDPSPPEPGRDPSTAPGSRDPSPPEPGGHPNAAPAPRDPSPPEPGLNTTDPAPRDPSPPEPAQHPNAAPAPRAPSPPEPGINQTDPHPPGAPARDAAPPGGQASGTAQPQSPSQHRVASAEPLPTPDPMAAFVAERLARFPNVEATVDRAEPHEVAFTVTRCRLVELVHAAGHPELAPLFCAADARYFGEIEPGISLDRPTTIAGGHAVCRFVLTRDAPAPDPSEGP